MFLERETHVLLHLLQAVIVGVDEVKGQRTSQWTTPSARRHTEKPATHKHAERQQKNDVETDTIVGKFSLKTPADYSANTKLTRRSYNSLEDE